MGDSDTVAIRKKLIQNDKVEAIIILPRELFITTDISVTPWILNQNKKGGESEDEGWHYLAGTSMPRGSKREVLYLDDMEQFLSKTNPDLTADEEIK